MLGMVGWGFVRIFFLGNNLEPRRAPACIVPTHSRSTGFAFAFLLLRTFSSGCAALTGVEAISNGVPAFKQAEEPERRDDAAAARHARGHDADRHRRAGPADPRRRSYQSADRRRPVTTQLARRRLRQASGRRSTSSSRSTALILVLAANTAFNGFPVLGSILAQDRYLPRQLHTRGDRLAFSNGILFLATFAIVLIVAFKAQPTHLIQLYIVGVFVSFTLSQTGMLRHWNRLLRTERDPAGARRMYRSRVDQRRRPGDDRASCWSWWWLTKFLAGAWISIAAMVVIYLVMIAIRRHYDHVASELAPAEETPMLPARNHAVVLVSKVHLPTLRALAYAQGTRPDTLTAVTVNVDDADTRRIQAEWEARDIPVPLTVVDSPYREITRPIIDFVKSPHGETRRATWSRCSSRSTSSASGWRTCCTTRARCGSRAGCSTSPASW